jgi:hypothetical protein
MEIILKDGKTVKIEAFNYSETYKGLLEGRPSPGLNRKIVERESNHHLWGEKRINVIMPSIQQLDSWIPPSAYRDLLLYIDKRESNMVVLWFDEHPGDKSLKEIIERGIVNIDWEKDANFF